MLNRKTPLEKEWLKLEKQELAYLNKRMKKQDSKLNQLLEEKVPDNLQNTLNIAFNKAFHIVFEKGTGIIEKTYNKEQIQQDFEIQEYTNMVKKNRKSLKAFSKKANRMSSVNTLLSGASGIGLGLLGIGLPDIAIFIGILLKNIYEISLNYGFDYQDEDEKRFILLLICGALSYGQEFDEINNEVNDYIEDEEFIIDKELDICIKEASDCLATELLYMKFLQGIPLVGAIGGAYDVVYMNKVTEYAQIKYRKRFYLQKMR